MHQQRLPRPHYGYRYVLITRRVPRAHFVVGVDDGEIQVSVDINVRHPKVEVRPDVLRVGVVALSRLRSAF